ncbi:MAG: sugar phosphate isomerase/epimerase [Anaerolineae bacterium]|jgi:sugar phosphate isomerase/epimerase|nr:sugar phosphate isomerase/epimerase [Anaerolineae bacterium]PKO03933.1 MAG: xylose isomerase [Chloroflexi bacterium HGW-Chloroflexi-5]
MRIGVFSVIFQQLPFEQALDKILSYGATAVEIGTGGLPGAHHCALDDLLESSEKRKAYLRAVETRGMIISAFSAHWDPIGPDKKIAADSDELMRKSIRLAEMLGVPVVNGMSGLPAGSSTDTMPNWVTCPWPPHFGEILDYQWNKVGIPYWQKTAKFAEEHKVKIGIEMHPGMLIYNVETMLRMREACGPAMGCNFDPSHLFWNGVDPVAAIRKLGDAIVHVHGKDCYVDPYNVAVNGCNDHKSYTDIPHRSWTFRSIGYGHDLKVWKDIVSALRMIGYDHAISLEHEDGMMSFDEGVKKGLDALKEVVTVESAGEMFWA